jgi:hypothetical protein
VILSIVLLGLILGVAVAQAKQGFFCAIILTALSLICCAAAVGTHDYVAVKLVAPYLQPDFAHPVALGLLFGVPLLLLRLAFDQLIRRSCLLPSFVDRIGAGVCGILTALVVVGMLAVCLQMIPFGPAGFMGFSRVPAITIGQAMGKDAPAYTADAPERELWLTPDRFALAAASLMSGGVFSDQKPFYSDYPDYIRTVGWSGAAPLGVSRYAKPKSINIVSTDVVSTVFRETPSAGSGKDKPPSTYEAIEVKGGRELRVIRVGLAEQARDAKRSHTFTLRQFRLVGRNTGSGLPEQYYPIAMQQESDSESINRHVRYIKARGNDIPTLDEPVIPRDPKEQVEMVFDLPKGFEPSFLEYKRTARVSVSFAGSAAKERATGDTSMAPAGSGAAAGSAEPSTRPSSAPAPTSPTTSNRRRGSETTGSNPSGSSGETVPNSGRGGNVRGATALSGQSGFSEKLPVDMKAYRQLRDIQIKRDTLINGHLVGEFDKQATGADNPVTKFEVPSDKRLLQLHTQKLKAGSMFGHAMTAAIETVQSYSVVDDQGRQFPVVGKYGIADVNGTRMIEVQYFPDQTQLIGGFGKFDKIKNDDLKGDYQFVLLFLVDPGSRIVSFSTGGSATRADDLKDENLVAPK